MKDIFILGIIYENINVIIENFQNLNVIYYIIQNYK